jgi:transposase
VSALAENPGPSIDRVTARVLHELYGEGYTLSDIGELVGVDRSELKEVFATYGLNLNGRSGRAPAAGPNASRRQRAAAKQDAEERAREMHAEYQKGSTLEEVGAQFGVTRERVRQLFRQFDLPVRSVRESAALQRELQWARADEVVEAFMELRDELAVAKRLDMPQSVVQAIVRERVSAGERRKATRHAKRYAEQELINCLKEARSQLGGVLTAAGYSEFARGRTFADGRPWPTHQTQALRFGSWRKALRVAGLRANKSSPIAGQRLFEVGHCLDAVRHLHRELGRVPTAADYERFAAESGGAYPSLATLRHRIGSWNEALRQAGI